MRVILARSPFRTRWDVAILALVGVSVALVPYQAAFQHKVSLPGSLAIYAIDVVFLIDLLLNFRTSYRSHGVDVTDPARIAGHYRHGLLAADLIGAVPFDLALLPWASVELKGVSIVLIVRLLRLARMGRLFAIIRRWQRHHPRHGGVLRIAKLLSGVAALLHVIACAWFLLPFMDRFPPDSWVAMQGLQNAGPHSQYLRSLYWVVVTTTTVGFGDITPHRDVEYVFTILVVLIGASTYAFIIANVASLVSSLDSTKAAYWSRVETITQYLHSRRVPNELNRHVQGYYEYMWARYRGASEQSLLHDLPPSLRLEVLSHLTRELVDRIPLFEHCGPALRNELLLALEPQVFTPGGLLVRNGEVANGIYFISRGDVEVVSADGVTVHAVLSGGDHFGELSLLLDERRTGSVRALEYCDVFFLPRPQFDRLRRDYSEFRAALKTLASERSETSSALVLGGIVL